MAAGLVRNDHNEGNLIMLSKKTSLQATQVWRAVNFQDELTYITNLLKSSFYFQFPPFVSALVNH